MAIEIGTINVQRVFDQKSERVKSKEWCGESSRSARIVQRKLEQQRLLYNAKKMCYVKERSIVNQLQQGCKLSGLMMTTYL